MIGVITASKTSGSVLGYDFGDKKEKDQKIHILASEGVFMDPELVERLNQNWTDDASKKEFKYVSRAVADDLSKQFDSQASLSDRIVKTTGHIALSFPEGDRERLHDDDFAIQIATEYMEEMGINDTQWVLTAHLPTPEQPDLKPHIHLAYNRVRYDGSVIDSKNERYRSQKIAAELSEKYGLTPAGESPRLEQSLSPVQQQFEQMRLMAREALKQSCTMEEFKMQLRERGIELWESEHSEQQKTFGLSYSMIDNQEISAKGSKLDRSALSYAKVTATLEKNLATRTAMEQKAVQETRLALQNLLELEESIMTAITRRVERLAKEATERAIKERQAAEEKARIEAKKLERANKNKFWNTYNSHYKPLVDGVQKSISDSFQMRDTLKAEIRDCGREISDRYDRLSQINDQINKAKNDIDRASSSKGLWTALSGLVTIVNPVAGLVMGLVSRLVIEANKSAAIETRKALYAEAKAIRDDIGILKEAQSQLRAKDAEVMKVAVEDKAARKELFDEINILKAELTKPIEPPKPKFSFDFKAASQQTAAPVSHSQTTVAAAMPTETGRSKVDVYSILLSSKTKDALDLALLEKKVVIEPMKDRYGGVADFSVTLAGEGRIVNASSLVSGDQLRQMVNKWENLTGQQPAYKLEIQREDQRKLADICAKMDAASPENAPRTPKSISHLPGGEIDVTYTTRRGNTTTARIDADGRVKVNNVMLDINTGRFTQLPGQRQAPRQSQEGKSKGNSLKK